MADPKKIMTRVFLGAWLVLFCVHYVFGTRGLAYGWRVRRDNRAFAQRAGALQAEMTVLEKQVNAWQHDSFYAQRLAREQLQLAREGETVYYVVE